MPIPSRRLPLGRRIPWFRLSDLDGREWTTASLVDGRPVLIMFLCDHSPYVRLIEEHLAQAAADYQERGVVVLAIAPNDTVAYPSDSPAFLERQRDRAGFSFPYCLDTTQATTKAFGSACTPEFFLYDREQRLVYHGRYDDADLSGSVPVTGSSLRQALDATLKADVLLVDQIPSFGCSVKWRAGNEPDYVLAVD
jgi:thiol-disulfide isomerase/thioredoxin